MTNHTSNKNTTNDEIDFVINNEIDDKIDENGDDADDEAPNDGEKLDTKRE